MTGWRDSAACFLMFDTKEADSLFFSKSENTQRAAKRICNEQCPVREECLDDAMLFEGATSKATRHGVRGGLTGEERARLYARRQRARWR